MMDFMRRAAKSWVAKALIFMLAASFGIWGIQDVFRGYSMGSLATVGSEKISPEDFKRAFDDSLRRLQRQTGQALSPEDARKLGFDRQVLDQLINNAAIDGQVKAMGLAVGKDLIVRDTQENPAFQDSQGKFDVNVFRAALNNAGLTEEGFFATERKQRLGAVIPQTVAGLMPVSETLGEIMYRHGNEQRDARYFVVKTADSEVAQPTDADIKAQYDANPQLYTAPEYRTVAVMTADPAELAKSITISDADLKAGFDKYKTEYSTPEKRTILQITFPSIDEAKKAKDRIAAGTDFLAIATERGLKETDITFADKVPADFIDKTIAGQAFTLPEGAVSDPIKGLLSTALIKVAKITPAHQATLDEVKDKLTQRLAIEQAQGDLNTIYGAVEDARGGGQTKFDEIAKAQHIAFQQIGPIDAQGKGPDGKEIDFPNKGQILQAAFASDVGVDNAALTLPNGGYVWYNILEVKPSAVKPLADVKDQAAKDVVAARVRKLSEDKASKLVDRLRGGAKLDDLAKELSLTVENEQGLKRGEPSDQFDAGAVAALFAVPDTGFAWSVDADGKSAKVMQSQPVLLPPYDPKAEPSKKIASQISNGEGQDLLASYLGAIKVAERVNINETLWRQIAGTTSSNP